MLCVVPLAGPDFYSPRQGIKAFSDVGSQTLIEATLRSRGWAISGELPEGGYVFVLRDTPQTGEAAARLCRLFPGSRTVVLSGLTGGALLSAAAGAALVAHHAGPLVVDLADILYRSEFSPTKVFSEPDALAGIVPYFASDDPAFSYLRLQGDRVQETAEKRVISGHASAGTYFFRNAAMFFEAVAGTLSNPAAHAVNGSLFVCPCYNILIGNGRLVKGVAVTDVRSYSKKFHVGTSDPPPAENLR